MTDSEPGDDRAALPADEQATLPGDDGTPRGHRRAVARQKAQRARLKQKRRARGGRYAIAGGIVVVVLAAAAVVVFTLTNSHDGKGLGPANMAGDGITIGKGFKAVKTGAQSQGVAPSASSTAASADTVAIVVYSDFLSADSGSFEKTNDDYIRGLVSSGAATVQFHPLALLTNQSLGTAYSVRAANAAACVANFSPDAYYSFNTALFERQPAEGTAGLTDAQLVSTIRGVDGITNTSRIATCVTDQTYKTWVTDSTQRALDGPLANSSLKKITTTPTVLVNGQQYKYTTPFTTTEFSTFVVTAAGSTFATSTPTPSPSGSATPAPSGTSTPTSTGIPTATATPEPTASASATPSPSATP
ncbi:DsbA family protein [Frondihabitans cladoniiphilus]|uniref:Thioredoxin-like fold domain-containing protein n=1 Tax=Frondihabitans cladoniiphilus TaxID=715785 RepID=A0ABP8VVM9_9MICO